MSPIYDRSGLFCDSEQTPSFLLSLEPVAELPADAGWARGGRGAVRGEARLARFMMRGLETRRGECKLHTAAHNLRKLHQKSVQDSFEVAVLSELHGLPYPAPDSFTSGRLFVCLILGFQPATLISFYRYTSALRRRLRLCLLAHSGF